MSEFTKVARWKINIKLNMKYLRDKFEKEWNSYYKSKWVDQKTIVHLHNGILHSRKKERAPSLHDSMDALYVLSA